MAKIDRHDARIKNGIDELRKAGLEVDAPGETLVPQLMANIGKSPDIGLAAIFLLGKIPEVASLDALRALGKSVTDKEVKKELKRALFKLAQKGLSAPREEEDAAKRAVPIFERTLDIEAYMSAVDGGGGRLIWIAKAQPSHGLQVIQAMLHDRDGLLRYGGVHMKRKELRGLADEIKRQNGVSMIAIPWEYADVTIYNGYEKAKGRGQSGLENFHEIRSLIATGKPKSVIHPIYQKLGAADFREGSWREQSRRLLDEPELRYWIVVDDWVKDYLSQIDGARTSPLVLNQMQKEERLAAIVRDAIKTLCSGENGKAFKQRMEDTALYFLETRRNDLARLALAVAQQVGEGEPGPLDVLFLTGLMQKSFAFFMAQQKAKAEEEQSALIIKP